MAARFPLFHKKYCLYGTGGSGRDTSLIFLQRAAPLSFFSIDSMSLYLVMISSIEVFLENELAPME